MTAAERTPVVLLHALSLDSTMWHALSQALRERGHPVLAPDQRGFGGTPLGDAPPSLAVVVDDLARDLDERHFDRVALVGASLGGYVAMAFLRRHPDRVAALGLVSTRAAADTARERAERERFAELVTDQQARGALVAATTPRLVGATTRATRPEVLAAVQAMVDAAAPESIAWAQRAIAGRPDAFAVLRAADIPALVVSGAEDELIDRSEPERMASALPRGRLVTIPTAGHLPPVETPEALTVALLHLLDSAHQEVSG
ncbi:alpha/beta hydrolase [Phytohabitans flavus]|uniref:Alpha/beta hydrolase n=1 Tax=Phytohabitans flavus TaxID=1076124 RepID=A0A6F8XMZ2_9ACTN|nr:alpha/beta hydrolase [Phytohabitans flavus]BCB75186.1 alpha/beta hydrolase [Phytohabitans flavus]